MEVKEKINIGTKTKSYAKSTLIFNVSLVFLFNIGLALSPQVAAAANLYFSPSSGTYSIGRNFTVSVRIESSAPMNAASGIVTFPTDKLEVLSVSKTGSIFNLWVQEPFFSNSDGDVNFEGIILNPGFNGDGKLISVTFRDKSDGKANLSFSSGSILANDGLGTNILSSLGTASFTILSGAVSVPEEVVMPNSLPSKPLVRQEVKNPDGEMILVRDSEAPEKWTMGRYNKLSWIIPSGVTGVSFLLNNKPISNPGSKSDGFFDNKIYENLDDGIYYAHIRFINSLGAGSIEHFKLMVDATPPDPFTIILPDGETTANPTPRIKFETTDDLSGIDRYEMKIDDGNWFNAATLKVASYILPKLSPGEHQILVRAYDKAGNYTEEKTKLTIIPIESPKIIEYPTNIISPGEKLALKGTAIPKATVEIHMTSRGQGEIVFNAQADENGNWTAIYENIIPSGIYNVSAKQILDTGAQSLLSQPISIGVNSWFWRAWQYVKNVGGIIGVLLVLLAGLAVTAYYFWHRFKLWRIKLKREIHQAESTVKSSFKKLKKEIKNSKAKSKFIYDLSEVERDIEKEIKDIEKK